MKFKANVITNEYRKYPIGAGYRPHLALKGSENLLGIHFNEVSECKTNEYADCMIETSYDEVDYSDLVLNGTYRFV